MNEAIISNSGDYEASKKDSNGVVHNEMINVDHFKAVLTMRYAITKCPMDEWCKRVMLMRVGRPWAGEMPMTHLAIAIKLKCKEKEVYEIEAAGKILVEHFCEVALDMYMNKKFENEVAKQAIVQENTIINKIN